jgi:hypothetical protein
MVKSPCFIITFFLLLCDVSFAGDIKVIGTVPKTDTGKTYQLQIGAFDIENNVKKAIPLDNAAAQINAEKLPMEEWSKLDTLKHLFLKLYAEQGVR